MSKFQSKIFEFNTPDIEENDLGRVKAFNTTSRSGMIYNTGTRYVVPDFESTLIKGNNKDNIYLWNLICQIRNWHFSKFEYNLPKGLNKQVIENTLLIYGRIVLFKYGDGYKAFPFRVKKLDMDGRPLKVEAYSPYMSNYTRQLTVDKNCVIMYGNNDGLIFTITDNAFFGILWRVWTLILDVVEAKRAINNTYKMNVPKIAMSDVEQDEKDRLRESLESIDYIFDYDAQGKQLEGALKGQVLSTLWETKPMVAEMWSNFQNYLEVLYTTLGVNHNPNNDKKERQITSEVKSNNQILISQIDSELEIRETQIEKFNKIFNENMSIELTQIFKEEEEPIEPLETEKKPSLLKKVMGKKDKNEK